jgi:phosphonate transport system permease protein
VSEPDKLARTPDRRRWILAAIVAGSVLASGWYADVEPTALADAAGARSFLEMLSGFAHPDLSPEFLRRIGALAVESLLIGALGTAAALLLAIPLAVLASRPPSLQDAPVPGVWRNRLRLGTRLAARGLLALFRSVPEIVWAFLFVRIFGLGPGAGVFALGLTFSGIIGKLFAELIEAADPIPARRLRAAGASSFSVFFYGVLPLVRSQWIAYALFRLECAIRSASILGVVGAGGLGFELSLSIRYFQYDKLATALLAVLAYVVVLEIVSYFLRRASPGWPVGAFVSAALAGILVLDIPWASLADAESLAGAIGFLQGFGHPNLSGPFVLGALQLCLLTVAMAWCSTIVAAGFAFVLAPLSAVTFTLRGYLDDAPQGRGLLRWAAITVVVPSRLVLQITRALPELVWALLFVLWVGPGVTAGVLALTMHTIGILGRLYGDALEEAEPDVPRSLEAAGSGALARYLYGVMPQCLPRMLAFTLFRFEVNIRAAVMVGFVGAGGLGDAIDSAIAWFHWDDLATLLLVLLGVVLITDWIGDRVRFRLLSANGR